MLTNVFQFLRARERGQVLMMTAVLLPMLLGFTAMAVDLGSWSGERRNLQKAADSIALAAVQELCKESCATYTGDQGNATAAAIQWAHKNDINPSEMTVTFPGSTTDPRVRVVIGRDHDFAFIRILGIKSADVDGKATAAKVSVGGASGVVPWTVTQFTVNSSPAGDPIVLKYDATGGPVAPGNFGAIRIDGSGSATYRQDAMYGSNSFVCAVTAENCVVGACPGTYPETCAEDSPTCDGPVCDPETGNMTGPTRTAVDFRLNNTSAECDTFAEAFGTPDAFGKYHLDTDCNPWNGPGQCDSPTDICSRRVIIIPVVDDFGNGQTPVTFQRFALVYLEGYTPGKCRGKSCEIIGRFVNADVTPNALAGAYDEGASIHFWKLVE